MTSKSNAWMQAKAEEVSSLQEKLREATRVASALRSEKRSLVEATDLLQSTNSQLKANLGELFGNLLIERAKSKFRIPGFFGNDLE